VLDRPLLHTCQVGEEGEHRVLVPLHPGSWCQPLLRPLLLSSCSLAATTFWCGCSVPSAQPQFVSCTVIGCGAAVGEGPYSTTAPSSWPVNTTPRLPSATAVGCARVVCGCQSAERQCRAGPAAAMAS
jgi:hypothetical protein